MFQNIDLVVQSVAALAVIASVIYAAVQIRRNTVLARNQLVFGMMTSLHEFLRVLGSETQIARVWRMGLEGDASLSQDEKTQYSMLMMAGFVGFENQMYLYRSGMFANEMKDRADRQIIFMLSQPGGANWWRRQKINLSDLFIDYVDRLLASAAGDQNAPAWPPVQPG